MTHRSHLIILGGFLGAGKTTAVARLARLLGDQGLRVAAITNDQGVDLVDTAFLRAAGLPTAEISGGCFCCRFDALVGARGRLMTGEPVDVFIAEAVGSCTDLAATVVAPMRRLHGESSTLAPLSVVIDAVVARRVLGLEGVSDFSADVGYIYRKQIEEADIVVINKADLLDDARMAELREGIMSLAPHARVHVVSLRGATDLSSWVRELLFGQPRRRPTMTIDYDRYADGEARLGWLNATLRVEAASPFDPDQVLLDFVEDIRTELAKCDARVAHLKVTLRSPASVSEGLAIVNLVRRDAAADTARRIGQPIGEGEVLVNLRAEGAPEILEGALRGACFRLEKGLVGMRAAVGHLECFRPGRPRPTHRDVDVATMPTTVLNDWQPCEHP